MKGIKERHLDALAAYVQDELYVHPQLHHFFLELTLRCNAHCFHCGSNCTAAKSEELSLEEYHDILDQIKEDFDISKILLCITGGEPLLREDFFDILGYAHKLGYHWGMTTNATLITPEVARKLQEVGMSTVSVSIDGLPQTHDELRGLRGGYELAMQGIQNLIDRNYFKAVQVTTVINHKNIEQLDDLFNIMDGIDLDSWRVINLEPIGRALSRPDLMCTREDYRKLFDFIKEKRAQGYPVEYDCSHYLGLDYEVEVRDWYWLCNAGVHTGCIMANGDIGACLDIERRPETIQGNIRKDRFSDVWFNRFEIFRENHANQAAMCQSCKYTSYCRGDAYHSWDYDNNKPLVCMKGILFD